MDFRALQKEAHTIAKDHGWWDEERTFGDLTALVHSELSEALEAYRKYEDCLCHYLFHPMEDEVADAHISRDAIWPVEGVPMELADVVIRVADMAEHYGVDMAATFESIVGGSSERDMSGKTFGDWISLCHATFSIAFAVREYDFPGETWQEHMAEGCYLVQRMAAHYGIDLDAAFEAKMEYNRSRSYRHGGKAL